MKIKKGDYRSYLIEHKVNHDLGTMILYIDSKFNSIESALKTITTILVILTALVGVLITLIIRLLNFILRFINSYTALNKQYSFSNCNSLFFNKLRHKLMLSI